MSGYWSITNRATAGNATATQTAVASASVGSGQLRLRALSVAMTTAAAGIQVLDGATVIYQMDFAAANAVLTRDNLDIRATPGNNLTVQTTGNSSIADVNAQGDIVPIGYPIGLP